MVRKYHVFSVSCRGRICHELRVMNEEGEVLASPSSSLPKVPIAPELRKRHGALTRSSSVTGAASTLTLGTLNSESTSSEGLICGCFMPPTPAPCARR